MVRSLLMYGAKVNIQNHKGENPEKITEEYEDEGNVNRVTKLLRHPDSI